MYRQVRNHHRIRVAAPADTAFMFFTPAGEELWVEGWKPNYIHPSDGTTREGMVFTTGSGEDFTIWQLVDFDKGAWRSRYVRTTPALRTGTVLIRCTRLDGDSTEVDVCYEMTALTAAGNASLAAYEGQPFTGMIDGWASAISAKLPALRASRIR